MTSDFLHLLTDVKFFSLLPEDARLAILPFFEKISLKAGQILFEQSSISDYVYILLEGQLLGYVVTHDEQEKVITTMQPVEVIGELSALSGEPRSLSIKAARDSELFRLPTYIFEKICQEHPAILLDLIKTIITRSQESIQIIKGKKSVAYVTLFPAKKGEFFNEFKAFLKENLKSHPKIGILEDQDFTTENINDVLVKYENTHEVIIIFLESYNEAIFKISAKKQNDFYMVADAQDKSCSIEDSAWLILNSLKHLPGIKPYLILVHPDETEAPKDTIYWLKLADFNLHHHVRMHHVGDYQRLMRYLFGTPIGLVLSGGGTRVWAHGGVIKALVDKGIPIDALGGTSSGSWVAAGYTSAKDMNDFLENLAESLHVSYKSFSFIDLTWPAISLFSSHKVTNRLKNKFKDTMIEDLWVPFFCVTSNLTEYKEEIHHTGEIWNKVRASISIPGIFPPVILDGEMHFDGGLMNNLPVDAMKRLLGPRGIVIASQLGRHQNNKGKYLFPPVLTLKETFLTKIGLAKSKYLFPQFIDTFLSMLMIGSAKKEKENSLLADILINPDLASYSMVASYKLPEEEQLIESGYKATNQLIESKKEKLFKNLF